MTRPLHAIWRQAQAYVSRAGVYAVGALIFAASLEAFFPEQSPSATDAAAARAVSYLTVEVPRWRREHPCYSCHNNGDATRALIAASMRGHVVGNAIDDTLAWLATPERWDGNARRGGSEELPLARIQFASALGSMAALGRATPGALDQAARLLIGHQHDDGSWRLSESQVLGGATFYGTSLATAMARGSLARAVAADARGPLAKANAWLRVTDPVTVLDASAVLLGLERDSDPAAIVQCGKALDVLRRGQGPDGGFGPYVVSQSEPFDTALALLALTGVRHVDAGSTSPSVTQPVDEAIRRARAYLVATQNPDGSWPETTRPPNGESYAQRISTTGWSLLALLEP